MVRTMILVLLRPLRSNRYPLKRVLRMWNHMYDTGKFMSRLDNDTFSGLNAHDVRSYTPSDFDVNIAAWNGYLEAIIDRCPSCSIDKKPGLIDREVVDRYKIRGFLRDFLLNAKRPNFPFIAPGLRIPTSEYYSSLLSADLHSPRWHLVREDSLIPGPDQVENEREHYGYDFTQEPLPIFLGPNITVHQITK